MHVSLRPDLESPRQRLKNALRRFLEAAGLEVQPQDLLWIETCRMTEEKLLEGIYLSRRLAFMGTNPSSLDRDYALDSNEDAFLQEVCIILSDHALAGEETQS